MRVSVYSREAIEHIIAKGSFPDNTAVIIVEELHFQNRFAVKVDVDSRQHF